MCMISLLLCLVADLNISFAYDLLCPDPSQVHLRRKVCNNGTDEDSKYACLVDVLKNNTFRESCEEEPSFVRPGRKYVFSGSSTDESCSPNRYQPVPFAKAMYSMCILLKSTCNELGQVLSSNTSGTEDSTCRCDHSTGYAYISEPKNIFKCIPSQEDCTCYRKKCPSNGCLSSDYKCIEANTTHCSSIVHSRSESVPTTTLEIPTQLKDQIELFSSKFVSIPTVLVFVLTISVILCTEKLLYRQVSLQDSNAKWDGDHLYTKIIGHWKLFKENMSLTDLNTLLTKEGLLSQPEIDQHEQESLNWQKDFCLIKVLKATKQGKYVNKCTKIITAQRKLDEILRRPIQVPKWHKRGKEICRKQIQDNKLLLKEMFNPALVMDDFMQSFIFDVDQYEDITSSGVIENTLETFLKELDKTLNKGSFECLLTTLEKSKEPILSRVLNVLKTGLVQASMTSGTIFNGLEDQGLQNNQKVLLSIKPVATQITECDFQDQVMKYCTYFIEEFGLHLESDFSLPDIWLYPIVTDVEKRLRRGIQNGALSRLLENLLTATSDKWSEQGILCVNVIITLITNNSKDNLIELSRIQTSSMHNIVASNKSLIESELDCDEFVDSLVKKGFKDFERVRNDDKQFFKLLEDKVDDKTFLKMFLKIAEDTMSVAAFKKLQTYNKVWSADSTIIPDKILENVSTLAEIWTELQDFREICIERNILSAAFFEEIEKKFSEDQQFIEILVHIVQFGNRDAALALVETLYNKGHDLLASDILFMDNRIDTEKEDAWEKIIEVNTRVEDEPNTAMGRSFFEGVYSLQIITGNSGQQSCNYGT